MTSIGESEMDRAAIAERYQIISERQRRREFAEYIAAGRRRSFAVHIASGPNQWQEATRDAIMEGYAPIPTDTRYSWRWHIAAFIALCVASILFITPVLAQVRGSSTQTAAGISCNSAAVYDASTSGSTQLVAAGLNGEAIYVCGYTFFSAGTVNVELDYGTGSACATGTKKIVPAYEFTAQTGISDQSPIFRGLAAPSGNALCIKVSGSVAVQAIVYFAQF